jgi:predicted O-methyltransferase YrrM
MVMNAPQFRAILKELEAWGRENDRAQTDRSLKMLNLERETAQLVRALVVGRRPQRILEIGTSNGYSTIWLAASVAPGGRVTSIDRNPAKLQMAKQNLERAGLLSRTELILGNATEVVAGIEGPIDVVFFDADRVSAPEQLALLLPKLAANVLLLADNVLSHPEEIAGYLAAIEELPDFEHTVVPVGKGLSITHRSA